MERRQRGFTLIELMTVVVITTILTTVGIGSLRSFAFKERVNTVAREFFVAVTTARSEAVRRSTQTVVQLLLNDDVAVDEVGVVAFIDNDANYTYDVDIDETIHRYLINGASPIFAGAEYSETLNYGGTFVTTDPKNNAISRSVVFNSQGFSIRFGAAGEQLLTSASAEFEDALNSASPGTPFRRIVDVTVAGAARVRVD